MISQHDWKVKSHKSRSKRLVGDPHPDKELGTRGWLEMIHVIPVPPKWYVTSLNQGNQWKQCPPAPPLQYIYDYPKLLLRSQGTQVRVPEKWGAMISSSLPSMSFGPLPTQDTNASSRDLPPPVSMWALPSSLWESPQVLFCFLLYFLENTPICFPYQELRGSCFQQGQIPWLYALAFKSGL